MARASEAARYVVVDVGLRLARRCEQHVQRSGRCTEPIEFLCDVCGKGVCRTHIGYAHVDPATPSGYRSRLEQDVPEVCVTCALLERWWGQARVEEIGREVRLEFYLSETAVPVIGERERCWLEEEGRVEVPYGPMARARTRGALGHRR
jgi:hypothetical protein